jgi:uncharacterized protein YdhG (YjbR/CyaY superfamily)
MNERANEIDDYIEGFPEETRKMLSKMREAIIQSAPQAEETIKYMMPTYVLNGNLVHFAGYKSHIGFYPTPSGIAKFKKELSEYKTSKGAIQFPLNKPLPVKLITEIVKFRVNENLSKLK